MKKLVITSLITFPLAIILVMGIMYLGEPELRNDFTSLFFKATLISFPVILIRFYFESKKIKKGQ